MRSLFASAQDLAEKDPFCRTLFHLVGSCTRFGPHFCQLSRDFKSPTKTFTNYNHFLKMENTEQLIAWIASHIDTFSSAGGWTIQNLALQSTWAPQTKKQILHLDTPTKKRTQNIADGSRLDKARFIASLLRNLCGHLPISQFPIHSTDLQVPKYPKTHCVLLCIHIFNHNP